MSPGGLPVRAVQTSFSASGQKLAVKRQSGGASEENGARRLRVQAGGVSGGSLGLKLVCLVEMAQRQHLVAMLPGSKGEVSLFHRVPMGCLDAAHVVSTQAKGVPNSTTTT